MTLRLVRECDAIWRVRAGAVSIGSVQQIAGGNGRGRWAWSIFWLFEPGWNWTGGEDTRDSAMESLGAAFRRWLEFAALEETEDPIPRHGAPFTIEPYEGDRHKVLTPAGLHVGFAEPFLTAPELVSMPRELRSSAWITKFHDPAFQRYATGASGEEAVAAAAAQFRQYLATAGLRERF